MFRAFALSRPSFPYVAEWLTERVGEQLAGYSALDYFQRNRKVCSFKVEKSKLLLEVIKNIVKREKCSKLYLILFLYFSF